MKKKAEKRKNKIEQMLQYMKKCVTINVAWISLAEKGGRHGKVDEDAAADL
ncbi:MAG: hypothetical protein Q3985_04020 [Eubacteriales bacterium]|nr:hypothetical protein [Eubacteriales bacterium]